jgi:hypothetical protein
MLDIIFCLFRLELQANPDRPDLFQLEWGFLVNELAFVPELASTFATYSMVVLRCLRAN